MLQISYREKNVSEHIHVGYRLITIVIENLTSKYYVYIVEERIFLSKLFVVIKFYILNNYNFDKKISKHILFMYKIYFCIIN